MAGRTHFLLNHRTFLIASGSCIALLVVAAFISSQIMGVVNFAAAEQEAVIEITDAGFKPETLKIKAGTRVVWRNTSKRLRIIADPTDESAVNSGAGIVPGGIYSYVYKVPGDYEFQDTSDESIKGSVEVTK